MPPCSKSNTGSGATGAHTEKDLDVNFDHFLSIFSRSCCYFSTRLFFQILQALICRTVWVSCPSMRSRIICRAFKVGLMSTQISETMKISNSGQLWASDGRIFRQFPVLTHNFHQPVTRRAPSCKGCLRALRVIRWQGQTGTNWPSENP